MSVQQPPIDPLSFGEDNSLPRLFSNTGTIQDTRGFDTAFHARQTMKGFAGGLVLVIPTVLWLAGSHRDELASHTPAVVISQVSVKPLPAPAPAPIVESSSRATEPTSEPLTLPPGAASLAPASPPAPAVDLSEMLLKARDLAAAGQIQRARDILNEPALDGNADAAYLLAETYDPNILAALGLTDVKAEAERARSLYEKALAQGITGARQRIEALE